MSAEKPAAHPLAYADFLAAKAPRADARGLSRMPPLSAHLFDFQRHCVEFLLSSGSGGLFLDTGLGKTLVQLEYSEHARQASNGMALILTPIAVAKQIEREARKFGYDARVIRDQSEAREGINICNYDRMHLIDPRAFGSVTLDEGSILKSFGGKTSRLLTDAFATHRWRVPATATPAPNDHMELGTYAEFCGVMQSNEMLSRFFINDTSQASQQWRLKRYGVEAFWDWMASWCRLAQMPSDLGGDDSGFELPPIRTHRHRAAESAPTMSGGLFGDETVSATNMHQVKRATAEARATLAANLVYNWQSCGSQSTPLHAERSISPMQPNGNGANDRAERPSEIGNTCPPIIERTQRSSDEQPNNRGSITNGAASATHPILSSKPGVSNTRCAQSEAAERENSSGLPSCDQSDLPQSSTTNSSESRTDSAQSAGQSQSCQKGSDQTIATNPAKRAASYATDATSGSDSSRTAWSICKEPWCIWVDTDYEQDAVEAALTRMIGKNSFFSIRGSTPVERKESEVLAWIDGDRPILVSKPSICGFGMNFQHCAQTIFVGRSFSYEAWYQAVRRFWRFGQKREVQVHLVVAEGEDSIARVIDRKADDHASMKVAMRAAMQRNSGKSSATKVAYLPTHKGSLPQWIA